MKYDRQGKLIDLKEWALLLEDQAYQRIDETYVGEYRVSTVWLGLDYGMIFETLMFGHNDEDGERYRTEAAAREGHQRWVQRAKGLTTVPRMVAELREIARGLEAL